LSKGREYVKINKGEIVSAVIQVFGTVVALLVIGLACLILAFPRSAVKGIVNSSFFFLGGIGLLVCLWVPSVRNKLSQIKSPEPPGIHLVEKQKR
jgi:hypothetical protein